MQLKNKPTFIDLFAGCGGLSLGLEKAGFFPLYVNELNADALEAYLKIEMGIFRTLGVLTIHVTLNRSFRISVFLKTF